jgi:transposase
MPRAQKRGAGDEAIGRSRGGLSTKIHAAVDALGNPLRFILTAGQAHESKQAETLIDGFDFDKLLADKGFDSDRFRAVIATTGAEAVIPSNGSRKKVIAHDEHVYKERNVIERFFNKISAPTICELSAMACSHAVSSASCSEASPSTMEAS